MKSTTNKITAKRAVKPATSAAGNTREVALPASAGRAAPKTKRVRKPALPKAERVTTVKRATAAKASRKPKSAKAKAGYTNEDIALRAYFIAQKRQQLGQFGSPESDWLEAEHQLREGLPT